MKIRYLTAILLVCSSSLLAQTSDAGIPHLEKRGTATQLVVDGKPFLILGAELLNSSSSSLDFMQAVWPRLAQIPLNTVLTPLSWELVEPREGRFNFDLVDGLIQQARQNNLHIVFLWLASWKNGMSSYAPIWVKENTRRFPRVVEKDGHEVEILSPLSEESMNADARAFAEVMRHIRQFDGDAHTVVMMQVENEVGVLGDSRDRSAAANQAFDGPVPSELTSYLESHRDTLIPEFKSVWQAAGAKTSGTWQQLFGRGLETDKLFMAWYYGRYIQHVAAAGKAEYPIPMYVNTWLAFPTFAPGVYPSGGPLPEVMDVWRAAGNAIDIYSPDIYASNYAEWCDRYHRSGNPLFIPEARGKSVGQATVFYTIGQHEAIGFSPFGIDSFADPERDSLNDTENEMGKSYSILTQIAPVILQHEGKGEMAGFMLNKDHPQASADLGDCHLDVSLDKNFESAATMGFGLVIATGPNEFLGAGRGIHIAFSARTPGSIHFGIGSIDEGTFTGGVWTPGRRLNGDENDQGRYWRFAPSQIRIEKAVVYRYQAKP